MSKKIISVYKQRRWLIEVCCASASIAIRTQNNFMEHYLRKITLDPAQHSE